MADFAVQRGEAIIASSGTSVTITAGVDYTAPASATKAFIRIVASSFAGDGRNNAAFGGVTDENAVDVTDPGNITTSITFARTTSTSNAVHVQWEIVEYIGAGGGDYEFVVRHTERVNFTGVDTTLDSSTVSGVVTDADVVVFVTGQRSTSSTASRGGLPGILFTAEWVGASSVARLTRSSTDSGKGSSVSIAVVEFVGAGWRVERVTHTYTAAGSTETETLGTSVSNVARAFLHSQLRSGGTGPDDGGQRVWLSATNTVSFLLDGGADSPGSLDAVVWLVEDIGSGGTAMSVQRVSGSRADGTGPQETWTETITAVGSLGNTSIMGECATTSDGSDSHYQFVGFRLTATNTVTLSRGTSEAVRDYRFEVVEWPAEAAGGGSVVPILYQMLAAGS